MPLVSIGMPVYNGEKYLSNALQCHLEQTFTDFEIVLCDNCSSDRTREIAMRFAALDSRIRYYRSDQVLPPAENHNRTFSLSSGKYFKWSAHDDLINPSFLAGCVALLEQNPSAVLAYSAATIIDPEGEHLHEYTYKLATDATGAADRFGALVRADHRQHGAFEIYGLIRAAALNQIPPMGNYPRGDSLVLARLSLLGEFRLVPDVTFFSRDHSTRSVRALPARIRSGRSRLHRFLGTGPLPPLEWWDPTKKGKIDFPEWRIAREYFRSILVPALTLRDRLGCIRQLALWLTKSWMKLTRDLVIAAELTLVGAPGITRVPRNV